MFYCHEILTSREAGIATVWLVATLGSTSKHRKITRKSILEVDVPKACHIIIQPEAPMALRLQGNLLFGVARVLNRQYEYVLTDAQNIQTNMRMLLKAIRTSEIDLNAGKIAPEQLVIHDDPGFLPDFTLPGLDIDLSALGISSDESSRRSSILSPHSQRSSLSSTHSDEQSGLGLIVPSSDFGGNGHIDSLQSPNKSTDTMIKAAETRPLLDDEEEDFNVDPGFFVDNDGNLIEDPDAGQPNPNALAFRPESDSGLSAQVRQGLLEGLEARRFEYNIDTDFQMPNYGDDGIVLPEAEPFPVEQPPADTDQGHVSLPKQTSEEESSDEAEAQIQRRQRQARPLPFDETTELRTSDLTAARDSYSARMKAAKELKSQRAAAFTAKRMARSWGVAMGIGGVGVARGRAKKKSPLDKFFSGSALIESLTGTRQPSTGHKRAHEEDAGTESEREVQRARQMDHTEHFGHGDDLTMQDDGNPIFPGSEDVEIGRRAQATLEDPLFPWNVSASAFGSRQGSVARSYGYQPSIGGFPASSGIPGSIAGAGAPRHSSLERRASRITSASPLIGRGQPPHRYSSLEISSAAGEVVSESGLDPQHMDSQMREEFEVFGPGAAVDTQTAAQSQWVRATLTREAGHFLAFVKNEIETKAPRARDEAAEELEEGGEERARTSILFEELLPPEQHSMIVGAQALLHVLTLATIGQLNVQQTVGFGPIELSVPEGVAVGFPELD